MSRRFTLLAMLFAMLGCASGATAQTCGPQWLEGLAPSIGPNGPINAIAKLPNGGRVVGGIFSSAGGQPASNLARYTGGQWLPAGPGVDGTVWALHALPDGRVVVGGSFTVAGNPALSNVFILDGDSYLPMGSGVNGAVYAITQVVDGGIIVGGVFGVAGGWSVNNVARFANGLWAPVGSGTNGAVWALAGDGITQRGFFVGGSFGSAAGLANTGGIARFNGATYEAMGTGCNGSVFAIAVNVAANTVHVGGSFTSLGGLSLSNLGEWNGSSWQITGFVSGPDGPVYALSWGGNILYVGGSFNSVGGSPDSTPNLALLAGGQFARLFFTVPDSSVYALRADVFGADVGGAFIAVSERSAPYVTRIRDGVSFNFGNEVLGGIFATAQVPSSGAYVVGGSFEEVGGQPANNIALWDRVNWTAIGSGLNGTVRDVLVLPDGRIVAGGDFSLAGSVPAPGVAIWNGSTWSSPPSRIGSVGGTERVFAMELDAGGSLVVCGTIGSTELVSTRTIARLNLTTNTWSALGTGNTSAAGSMNAIVRLPNNDLIVGGFQFSVGGLPSGNIARWNGSTWSSLGTGINGTVFALSSDGSASGFLAGGEFSTAGGLPAASAARWTGTAWQSMSTSIPIAGQVYAFIRPAGTNRVFVGGSFSSLSGTSVSNIAEWTGGTTWAPVRRAGGIEGTDGPVVALQDADGAFLAGGVFGRAGDFAAGSIAAFTLAGQPTLGARVQPVTTNVGQSAVFLAQVPRGYNNVTVRWQRNDVPLVDGPAGASVGGGNVNGSSQVLTSPTDGTLAVMFISNVQLSDAGSYTVSATNDCGGIVSFPAALTVNNPLCDSIDFNGDGLFPDDNDLIDLLSVLAGGPCGTGLCNDIDFNNDGLFPDDNDLIDFLRVLAGGTCP